MNRENPASASHSAESQVGRGTNSAHSGMDGYYSGGGDDAIFGSRSDESLLHRAMASTAAFTSRSLESFGWPKPRSLLNETLQVGGGPDMRNARSRVQHQANGLYGSSSSSSMNQIPGNGLLQSVSQFNLNSPTASRSQNQISVVSESNRVSRQENSWRSPTTRTSRENVLPNDFFLEQVQAFPMLPIHIHKQINQTSGNQILNHFDVNLLRIHDGEIVGSTESVAVFTTKRDTDQCWLMAFMKKPDENTLRFNRLLTPNLTYKIVSDTAIEIDSSKLNSREVIKFVFNFGSLGTAAEFVQLLEKLKNKPWKLEHRPSSLVKTGNVGKNKGSLLSTALAGVEGGFREQNYPSTSQNYNQASKRRFQGVRFTQENASVFIQDKNSFQPLGTGTLKILHNGNSFDKLVLLAHGDDYNPVEVMNHYIYKWNEICILPEFDSIGSEIGWNCFWTACARIEGCPELPKFHAFKMPFGSKEETMGFMNAFQTSIAVADQIGYFPGPGRHGH